MNTLPRRLFFPLSAALWLTILLLDVSYDPRLTAVKYFAVCFCFLWALFGPATAEGRLTALSLFLSLGADWFLMVRNDRYLLGVALFTSVQLLHALRIGYEGGRLYPLSRLSALLPALVLAERSPLAGACLFYLANLALNVTAALALPRRELALGLLLFLCCDLCVGSWNLRLFPAFARVGIWLFYLPAQMLIIHSVPPKGEPLCEPPV